ncbi:MAG: tetratricopeptide repeat-containing sensor histidine kinase, partial [Candidatus Cloacimonetes bacterium]|nr:tetratricopeptide repeat-containing sensor histidine kinase [Candidatus Cloacimonadota bacterium]
IMQSIDDKIGISKSLNNIGVIFKNQKNYEKALEYYTKSLEILELVEDIDNKKNIGISLSNIGNLHFKLKNYDEALEFHFQALKIFEEIEDKWETARTFTNISRLFSKVKEFSKSLSYLERSLELTKKIKAKGLIKDNYDLFITLYSAQNNYQKAFEYFKLYSEIKDSIFNEESSNKIAEMQAKYDTEKKEKEAEIYKLKNIHLVEANKKIEEQQKHLRLITRILRHDLNNNLTVILSAIKMFFRKDDRSYLKEAIKKVKKSFDLIGKMRDLERLISSNQSLKLFSINKVLQEVLKNYQNKNINLSNLSGNILADDTIYSVFDNIISNAFVHGQTEKIDISMSEDSNNLIIQIADYGKGIKDSIKEKIFEESFRHGKTGNTGLGLFIVKRAMKSFEGTVYVRNNQPQGSVFILTFKKSDVIIEL